MTATDTKAGETGFADVTFDLVSIQYHALKAGHDYEQFVRDARDAGRDDIAEFIEKVATEDADRAKQCHEFLKDLSGSPEAGDAVT
jgi:glutamine synthetase adenylyltransferase